MALTSRAGAGTERVDMKLEVSSSRSRMLTAEGFYTKLEWRPMPTSLDNGFSDCSVSRRPARGGSVQVWHEDNIGRRRDRAQGLLPDRPSDVTAARKDLVARGIEVSEVFHPGTPGLSSRSTAAAASAASTRACHLQLVRHVSLIRRQWMAVSGSHNPAARPRT